MQNNSIEYLIKKYSEYYKKLNTPSASMNMLLELTAETVSTIWDRELAIKKISEVYKNINPDIPGVNILIKGIVTALVTSIIVPACVDFCISRKV